VVARDDGEHGRIAKGYGELIEYFLSICRRDSAVLHLDAAVTAIDEAAGQIAVRSDGGVTFEADAAIVTVPLLTLEPRPVRRPLLATFRQAA
jgi:hypothetical protein